MTDAQKSRNFSFRSVVNNLPMKTLIAITFVIASLAPAAAQTKTSAAFNGKWEGTFTLQRPDGSEANPTPIILNITQKGKEITGTAGPADQQEKIVNGVAADDKATFDVQMPKGPPFKFSLTLVKGRLQGEMSREAPDGTVRKAKVDAGKAAPEKK